MRNTNPFVLRGIVAACITAFVAILLLLVTACSDSASNDPASPPSASVTATPGAVVYGPINHDNPYEQVGLRHNALVHAGLAGLRAADTVSARALCDRALERAREWCLFDGIDADFTDQALRHGRDLRRPDDARLWLARFDHPAYSARETHYLRAIGELLLHSASIDETERGLLALEREILVEPWPAEAGKESAARIAISVAKHSFAYWKYVLLLALEQKYPSFRKGSIGEQEIRIEVQTPGQAIAAADIAGAMAGGEHAAVFGPLAAIKGAIVVGGTCSLVVATMVHHDKIIGFFKRLFGCDR